MTVKRSFTFPSKVEASDFVVSLVKQHINRYAWSGPGTVDVILEDEKNESLVDDLAEAFLGNPVDSWGEK